MFDRDGAILRLHENGVFWVNSNGNWFENGQPSKGPSRSVVKRYQTLKDRLQGHLADAIAVRTTGLAPDNYTDEQGNRIEAIPLVALRTAEWAMTHNVHFKRGNLFDLTKTIPEGSADIAVAANSIGEAWGLFYHKPTVKALRQMGLILKENGKLIVGNNSAAISSSAFFEAQ